MCAGDDLVWRGGADDTISCVEVAVTPDGVAVRHSDQPAWPWLVFSRSAWTDFLAAVRAGEFDAESIAAQPAPVRGVSEDAPDNQ